MLCRTLDSIDNVQPFVFLSSDNTENGRISCRNGLLNNFDLSPWTEINSDSNNDVKKRDENMSLRSTTKPKRKSTTAKPLTTKKSLKNQLASDNTDKPQKLNVKLNVTDLTDSKSDLNNTTDHIKTHTVMTIDDKLDFKNKTRRFSNIAPLYNPTRQYNDYYDEVQSAQSVVINNLPNKRPSRPYISVTENIDKYTYLINYVPRPTQSWRKTTRRNYDRDVVKVTYQSYDDTYRRPNRPYYNRDDEDFESRDSKPVTESPQSSARSNEELFSQKLSTETSIITDRLKIVTDKPSEIDNSDATTENIYKLLTFGYVGTYRGNTTNIDNDENKDGSSRKNGMTKNLSTANENSDPTDEPSNTKLSTFLIYDTATKPYTLHRPTRRNDDQTGTKDKYYFIHNVLRKYPDNSHKDNDRNKNEPTLLTDDSDKNDNTSDTTMSHDLGIEERSGNHKISSEKAVNRNRAKLRPSSVKTPLVNFEIIPSESK